VVRKKALPEGREEKNPPDENGDGVFDAEMRAQLENVFSRMENRLVLNLYLDEREVSKELHAFIKNLVAMTEILDVKVIKNHREKYTPCVKLYREDESYTGLAFHGIPGGHEFTSFVLGLYNAAGPGQALDEATRKQIADLKDKVDIKLLVTLSCTMCPDLVVAAQRIAAENPYVTAHVYDIRHFENLKTRYNVMSVPCMIVNDDMVFFGKKNVSQILSLLNG
jgi:thioredoxin reductase (NADPH)